MKNFNKDLSALKEKVLFRDRKIITPKCVNFSDNDYLGLRKNNEISNALKHSIDKFGNGSGSSHLVSGHHKGHSLVEKKIASLLNFESSLLFHSGYLANLAFFKSFLTENDHIFMDKLCHASVYDAVIGSKAKLSRFPHLNYKNLNDLLKKSTKKNKIIVTDTVFSMDGDKADLNKLINLSRKYKSYLYIDDAHGFGVYGETGLGLLDEQCGTKIKKDNIINLTTFGKAGGLSGAVLSASNHINEMLKQSSREYIYTTAMPPFISYGILKSIELITKGSKLRAKLQSNINLFRENIKKNEKLMNVFGSIQPILIKGNKEVINIQNKLLKKNIYVAAIRSPTVPSSQTRLRITLRANHAKKDILKLTDELNKLL